jgi:acyl carrier protein
MDGPFDGAAAGISLQPIASQAAIERWLVTQVALAANEDPGEIDITLPFSAYALDSAAAAELTAGLEDWLGLPLPPTLIWDYPSIKQLARHLKQPEGNQPQVASSRRRDDV